MAYRQISKETYEHLLDAFRDRPGNCSNASRIAGCSPEMAKRGWEEGWSPRIPWARCLKQVLKEEQEQARALQRDIEITATKLAREERDKARQDSVKTLAQEGQMVSAGRANVLGMLASATQLLPGVKHLFSELAKDMLNGTIVEPMQRARILTEYSKALKNLVDATTRLIEAERNSKGEPSKIIGLEMTAGNMSITEATEILDEVTALYALAKERGLIETNGTVIDIEPKLLTHNNEGGQTS